MDNLRVKSDIPAHVAPNLVFDFDLYNFDAPNGEYQIALKRALRAPGVPEVFWSPRNGGHWVLTRAADISVVLSDFAHFSSHQVTLPKQPPDAVVTKPLQVDPPDHVKYRQILAPGLSPSVVTRLGDSVRSLAIKLIEGFKARGSCEFISEFAEHLPVVTFMQLLNLPESERVFLSKTAEVAVHGTDAEKIVSRRQMAEYGVRKVQERRANPGGDLISTIGKASIDGEPLDDETIAGMVQLLLLAGLDTVSSMMGFFAVFMARNPAHRQQLIDNPSMIPGAVEELLRRYGIGMISREVVEDFEFSGVAMRRGDMVLVPTPLDGLDDQKFADSEQVDFTRKVINHGTFGFGSHRCMGAMLARIELRIFLEEWLRLIPDFQIDPASRVEVSSGATVAVTRLPLVWNPT